MRGFLLCSVQITWRYYIMGIDIKYQGFPDGLEILNTARNNNEFAENVFYPAIAFSTGLTSAYYYKDNEFAEIRAIYKQYPKIKNEWNYFSPHRIQEELIRLLEPEIYSKMDSYDEIKQTFGYKFVKGEKLFSTGFVSTIGIPVRYSSNDFIAQCLEYAKTIDIEKLTNELEYDVGRLQAFFLELSSFYRKIYDFDNLLVFVMEE